MGFYNHLPILANDVIIIIKEISEVSVDEGVSTSSEDTLSLSREGAIVSLTLFVGLLAFSQVPYPSQSTTVTITNPQNGATVNKVVNITGSWSGTANVYKCE